MSNYFNKNKKVVKKKVPAGQKSVFRVHIQPGQKSSSDERSNAETRGLIQKYGSDEFRKTNKKLKKLKKK